MTCVWAWADLGNHALQTYNIRQYWLIMSVLSIKKFNPEYKRVFFVDEVTYNFLYLKNWICLWDEVNIIDFTNTEYGNLYNIQLYSWPKIYSYGLVDDDILMLDIDIVFMNKFNIIDKNRIGGKLYDHINDFLVNCTPPVANLSYKWEQLENIQDNIIYQDTFRKLTQSDQCIVGAPIYCPKKLNKKIQSIINHIIYVENIYGGLLPNDTHCELEEEWLIAQIGHNNGGIWEIDDSKYKHGYTSQASYNINNGWEAPENILNEQVFEKYIK